jgi:hypothetical protein
MLAIQGERVLAGHRYPFLEPVSLPHEDAYALVSCIYKGPGISLGRTSTKCRCRDRKDHIVPLRITGRQSSHSQTDGRMRSATVCSRGGVASEIFFRLRSVQGGPDPNNHEQERGFVRLDARGGYGYRAAGQSISYLGRRLARIGDEFLHRWSLASRRPGGSVARRHRKCHDRK